MATRTAKAGTWSATDTLTAADLNKLPGGWIGYVEVTSDQGSITSETDLTGLSVTVTANSSRRIALTFKGASDGGTARNAFRIKESTTTLQLGRHDPNGIEDIQVSCVLTPSSGSHTYKVSLEAIDGGTANFRAGSTGPAFLLVSDIGPSS